VPTNPVLSWSTFWPRSRTDVPCILDGARAQYVTSGRMAIALALREMSVSTGDEVLVPAYHCPTMVYPIDWVGGTPRFYRVRPDLSVDLDDLASRITSCTRVVMAAHFFGFPQDLTRLRSLCDSRGISLLEDCAHAFFGGTPAQPIGSLGDYASASLIKFFPVFDGGCVVSRRHRLDGTTLSSAGVAFQLRAITNALERSISFGRLRAVAPLLKTPLMLKDALWSLAKNRRAGQVNENASGAAAVGESEAGRKWIDKKMSSFSRAILALSSFSSNIEIRRQNYLMMQDAFLGVSGCRSLFPELPEGVVPYAFPLLVEQPDPAFGNLRRDGLPLICWRELPEDVDADSFPVSVHYSRHLFQIPCHQALTEGEIGWMVERISAALSSR
jgi:dTDP-4-amino-4,6-dideoxygalactose transaminase